MCAQQGVKPNVLCIKHTQALLYRKKRGTVCVAITLTIPAGESGVIWSVAEISHSLWLSGVGPCKQHYQYSGELNDMAQRTVPRVFVRMLSTSS